MIIEGKELPKMTPPPKSDDGVQQVLKPEPGRPGNRQGWRESGAGVDIAVLIRSMHLRRGGLKSRRVILHSLDSAAA